MFEEEKESLQIFLVTLVISFERSQVDQSGLQELYGLS